MNNRKDGVDFSLWAANYYISKKKAADDAGIEFSLTMQQMVNMLKANRCFITGIPLTHSDGKQPKATDVTIDRMDNTKGYVTGNVHAVCRTANNFKSIVENPQALLKAKHMLKIIKACKI